MADHRASFDPTAILVPCALSREDAEDLHWFCRRNGAAVFLRSNCGAQIAILSAVGSAVPCDRCGGDRESGRLGSGVVPANARRYAARVEAEAAIWREAGREPPNDLPLPIDEAALCPDCKGRGFRPDELPRMPPEWPRRLRNGDVEQLQTSWEAAQITAWPTGSSVSGKSAAFASAGEQDFARMGFIGRRLDAVAQADPRAVCALDAYYAEDGDQLLPLYELVPAGLKLLRRSQGDRLELSTLQRLENELAAERQSPEMRRKALLDAAHDQARDLYQAACRAWNAVVHGARLRSAVEARTAEQRQQWRDRLGLARGAA